MRKKGFLSLSLICLLSGLSAGCADRTVDYDLNGAGTESAENFSLEQFVQTERWNDEITVVAEDGKEIGLKVNAEIVLPDTDAMSVVEVEETVIDGEYKKELLTLFFGDSEIYYHDTAHCTREELEEMIAETEDSISEVRSMLEDSFNDDQLQEREAWFEDQEERLQEYRSCLQSAKDTYTLAEDFDSCNEYAAYRDGVLYGAVFTVGSEERHTVSRIDIHAMDGEYQGPESLKDFQEIMQFGMDYMWSGGSAEAQAGTNECSFSREEARNLADRFVDQSGRVNQVCFEEYEVQWIGQNLEETDEEGSYTVVDEKSVVYGYEFVYGTGVDEMAFASFGGLTEFDQFWTISDLPEDWYDIADWIRIIVTDDGIIDVRTEYPITIGRVTEQVELLPLKTVQDILKNELTEHGDRYDFTKNKYFNTLELIYFRVKDDAKAGSYSYVPAWCLCEKDGDTYQHAVLVNAIDGSIIYLRDEL